MHTRERHRKGPQQGPGNSGSRPGGGRCDFARRATRSLVLWSGGVESTYTLVRLLRESTDRVFSHHVVVEGHPFPAVADAGTSLEVDAVDRLRLAITDRERGFEHTCSRVTPGHPGREGHAALLAFMAARVAMAGGFTPFDRILVGVNGDRDPGWDPASAACALRRARIARAIRAAYGCDETPQVYLWEPRPTRREMLTFLGPELSALTVSCCRAVHDGGVARPCGHCAGCRRRGQVPVAPLSASNANGSEARTPPPFRHLLALQSRRPAPAGEDAASDPPAP